MPIYPFIDLKAQRDLIRDKIDLAIAGVLDSSGFIMGRDVKELKNSFLSLSAPFALGCANGTDALQLVLMAEVSDLTMRFLCLQ